MPSELTKKIDLSLQRIETFHPSEGLYLAFSGGKDSVVCKRLLDMAGAKYDAHYRVTSVDPPELVRFIRDVYGDVDREVPRDELGKPITSSDEARTVPFPPDGENCTMLPPSSSFKSNPLRWASIWVTGDGRN